MARDGEPISDEDLAGLIQLELNYSIGGTSDANSDDSELTEAWRTALEYFLGTPRGDEVDGRSKVISMDLADMVEQTIAMITPAFKCNQLATFQAYNTPDQKQATAEAKAINWAIFGQNRGMHEFKIAIKDALLQRNGIMEVWIDEYVDLDENEWENVDPIMAQQIISQPGVELIEAEMTTPPTIDPNTGQVLDPGKAYLKTRINYEVRQLKVKSVVPEDFCVNGDHDSIFLEDARFVCHTIYPTRSRLLQMGYDPDIVDELPAFTHVTEEESRARSRDEQENEKDAATRSGDRIEVRKVFYQIDVDGDGINERRRIIVAGGNKILENEIYPIVPYAAGTCFIYPHRFWQLSMYDKIKQVQDIKTAFLRKTLDNAEALINQRTIVVPGQVNMDDVQSSRPTGIVRAKRTDAVAPMPVQNMGDTGFRMLNYMDKVRREGGGSQLDVGTQESMPVEGQSAHGMERWMTSLEQLPREMIDTLAETLFHETFRIAHALMRRYLPDQMMYADGDSMVPTIPGTWPMRPALTINVQESPAERQRRFTILEGVTQKQIMLMENGYTGSMTSEEKLHNALTDQIKYAGLGDPARYFIDPTTPEAIQARQQVDQSAAEQAEQARRMEVEQQDKLYKSQIMIEQMQNQTNQLRIQLDNAIKTNEQLRKWTELEKEYSVDIPGQGASNGTVQ